MATRMQQRRGTSAQWAAVNPVLADGEAGWDRTNKILKFGDGSTPWAQLPIAFEGLWLPVSGKAYDSERLDGLDSTAFALANDVTAERTYVNDRILPAGASRQLGIHYGSVTTFPTTSLRVGDRCYRSDLFCEMFYNGAAWRQTERATMTSAQRVALSTASKADIYVGFEIYESDTLFDRRWDGTYWEIEQWHGARAEATGTGSGAAMNGAGMALRWVNAAIASGVNSDFTGWTNIHSPGAAYASAGDGSGGPALMTYQTTAGQSIKCNAKGRVQVDLYTTSDAAVVGSSVITIVTPAGQGDGLMGGTVDERHRATGYSGSGFLHQWVTRTFYVNPGDTFGCRVYQVTSSGITVTYNAYLQAKYL